MTLILSSFCYYISAAKEIQLKTHGKASGVPHFPQDCISTYLYCFGCVNLSSKLQTWNMSGRNTAQKMSVPVDRRSVQPLHPEL